MARRDENTGFVCVHCGADVPPLINGSYRNHCHRCLWSMHLDRARCGDRASGCRGLMRPVAVVRGRKHWQLVHRCERCGALRRNRVAAGDEHADDGDAIARLSAHGAR